jgi:hypothetical protein
VTPVAMSEPGSGPVFVVGAPGAAARRVARWLGGRPALVHARCTVIAGLTGPAGRANDDRWTGLDAAPVRAAIERERELRGGRLQRIEHDPRLALNVGRMARWFPESRFVFVYRDARESLGRQLDRWRDGSTPHPSAVRLASGEAWSGPLPPRWSTRTSRPLAEVVAWQWAALTRQALDDLEALPPSRWCVAAFDRLLTVPDAEHRRLSDFLGLPQRNAAPPIFARTAGETSPDPANWLAHAALLTPEVLKLAATQANRAVRLFADPPQTRIRR